MNLLRSITEMPIKASSLRQQANAFADSVKAYYAKEQKKFKHVGDIEWFSVHRDLMTYVVIDDSENIVLVSRVDHVPKYGTKVDDVWVDEEQSGKRLFSKFLWFLRSREGFSPLYFGNVHSSETFELLKSGGFSKFKKTWVNDFENKEEEFNPNNMDEFYTSPRWKLKLESTQALDELVEEVGSVRFSSVHESWIKLSYDWQIL